MVAGCALADCPDEQPGVTSEDMTSARAGKERRIGDIEILLNTLVTPTQAERYARIIFFIIGGRLAIVAIVDSDFEVEI